MASTTTLLFFSIFLTTTTETTAFDTTAFDTIAFDNTTTPFTTTTLNTTISPSPSPFTTLSPPPPPTLQEPPQQLQFNTIIDAIIGAGDFSNWANLLSQTDPSIFPVSATLLVPDDTATTAVNPLDPLLFTYHVIPRRFTFSELCIFPTGARLPTLLPGNTLLITNNSAVNFTINAARLSHPDLFHSAILAVHGVSGILDYTHYGDEDDSSPIIDFFPANPTPAPMSIESPMSPSNPSPTYPVLIGSSSKSPANSLSGSTSEFYLSFFVVLVTLYSFGVVGFDFRVWRKVEGAAKTDNWSQKAIRRKTTGTGRMKYLRTFLAVSRLVLEKVLKLHQGSKEQLHHLKESFRGFDLGTYQP